MEIPLNFELTVRSGEMVSVGDWDVVVTPKGYHVSNKKEILAKRMEARNIILPFSVWDLTGVMMFPGDCRNVMSISRKMFDTVYIVEKDENRSGVFFVQAILSDIQSLIEITIVSASDMIQSGELAFYIVPIYPLEDNSIYTPVANAFSPPASHLKQALVKPTPGSEVRDLDGHAARTGPNTYQLAFTWQGMGPFYRVTQIKFTPLDFNPKHADFFKHFGSMPPLAVRFVNCQIKKWQEDQYVMEFSVFGDELPDLVQAQISVHCRPDSSTLVTDVAIPPHFNAAWGYSIPLYSPYDVSMQPGERLMLPVKGMFFKGDRCSDNLVCVVGGSNSNSRFVVGAEVWNPMSALALRLYNHSDEHVIIKAGSLVALALPTLAKYQEESLRFTYSDRAEKEITWDVYSLDTIVHSKSESLPVLTAADLEHLDVGEEDDDLFPQQEPLTLDDCFLLEDSQYQP